MFHFEGFGNNVEDESWHVGYATPPWAVESILDFSASLRYLEDLDLLLHSPVNTVPLLINRLAPLRSLSVTWWTSQPPSSDPICNHITQLISKSPDLQSLRLIVKGQSSALQGSLSQILDDCPPLKLRKLSVEGWGGSWNAPSVEHLRHLSSISLPAPRERAHGIVAGLHKNRILMSTIDTRNVSAALLDYMASYSGLERLRLADFEKAADRNRFYRDVLPRHSASLRHLSVHHHRMYTRDIDGSSANSIAACRGLVSLSVSAFNIDQFENNPKPVVRTYFCAPRQDVCLLQIRSCSNLVGCPRYR